jgi:hypothetical protein
MSKPDLQPVNLGSIARGALMEIFEIEIAKIAQNIADTKTGATKKRKLTISLSFKPDPDRKVIQVYTNASTTLAGPEEHCSRVYMGKDTTGAFLIFDTDPRQELLFEPPAADENLLHFGQQQQQQ